ncbi:MAG: carbonic anhydrase [Pseudobdellovibrionaceae bacterium]
MIGSLRKIPSLLSTSSPKPSIQIFYSLTLSLALSACAIETKRSEIAPVGEPAGAATQAHDHMTPAASQSPTAEGTTTEASAISPRTEIETQQIQPTLLSSEPTVDEPLIVLKDHHGKIVQSKLKTPTAPTHLTSHSKDHSHLRSAGPVPATQALGWLKNGNTRFRKGFLRKDGQSPQDIARLSKGQSPHAIVVSCSDSRVPPETVFDQKLGEIFVVRTAGQSLDSSAVASIEYAIEHLGSNLIVVMGHESCGAVKATLSVIKDHSDLGSPFLNQLAANIRPRLGPQSERTPASTGLLVEGWENTKGAARELVTKSEIIRRAIESGDVKMTSALYHLGSGEVEWSSK